MAQHDSSYKLLFSNRKMVADLIRAFVHEDWAAGLDLDTLQRVRESGITQDLREREDDVIWRLRTGALAAPGPLSSAGRTPLPGGRS